MTPATFAAIIVIAYLILLAVECGLARIAAKMEDFGE